MGSLFKQQNSHTRPALSGRGHPFLVQTTVCAARHVVLPKTTLFRFQLEVCFAQENDFDVFQMLVETIGENDDVINVNKASTPLQSL